MAPVEARQVRRVDDDRGDAPRDGGVADALGADVDGVGAVRLPLGQARPLEEVFERGVGVLAAAALWVHYGTAVFFEMIAAGISACF